MHIFSFTCLNDPHLYRFIMNNNNNYITILPMDKKRSLIDGTGHDDNDYENNIGKRKKVKKSEDFNRVVRSVKNALDELQRRELIDFYNEPGEPLLPLVSCSLDDDCIRMAHNYNDNKSRYVEQWTLGFGLSNLDDDVQFKGKPVAKHTWVDIYKVKTNDPKEILREDGKRKEFYDERYPSHLLIATNTTLKAHCVTWLIPIIINMDKFDLYNSSNGKNGRIEFVVCVRYDPIDPVFHKIQNCLYDFGAVPIRSAKQQKRAGATSIWPLCIGSNNRMTIRDRPMIMYLIHQRVTVLSKLLSLLSLTKKIQQNKITSTFWVLAYSALQGIVDHKDKDPTITAIFDEFMSLRKHFEINNNDINCSNIPSCDLLQNVILNSDEIRCWAKLPKDLWTLIGRYACLDFDTKARLQCQKIQFYRTIYCTQDNYYVPLSSYSNHFAREQCIIQTYFEGLEYLLDILVEEETSALHNLSDSERKAMKLSDDIVGAMDVTSRFSVVRLILQNIIHNYCGKLAYAMYTLISHPTAFKFAQEVYNIADGTFNIKRFVDSTGHFIDNVTELDDLDGPLHFIFSVITCMAMDHPVTMQNFNKVFRLSNNHNFGGTFYNTSNGAPGAIRFLMRNPDIHLYEQLPMFRECINIINDLYELVPNLPGCGKYLLEIYRLMRISNDMRQSIIDTDTGTDYNSNNGNTILIGMYHCRKNATVTLPQPPTSLKILGELDDHCDNLTMPYNSHIIFVRQWLKRFYAIEDAKLECPDNNYKYITPVDHFDIRYHFENNIKPRSAI